MDPTQDNTADAPQEPAQKKLGMGAVLLLAVGL